MIQTRPLFAAVCLALRLSTAAAQCPNGSPPPCKGAIQVGVPKRLNPALNDRAWIVVPFGNAMRAPDLDWLRDASVNLLSMDLGRWTDIKVIDDKQVGDLLRELPNGRAAALTLNDGLSIARRAGARNLVMGDFFRVGKGARIVVNVFDVRTGAKLRSSEQQTTDPDSLLTSFGPLARGVLAVPPPPDAKLGAVGTTRIDAYQAYLAGVRSLNRFEIEDAITQLNRALSFDSTFALAHYKLVTALEWRDVDQDTVAQRAHALAAARLGTNLPARERTLIAALVAETSGDESRACSLVRPLVDRDSTDVEAMYKLGQCSVDDMSVVASPTDSVGTFSSSWNTTIAMMTRVLRLDPTYHPAFQPILDALSAEGRQSCDNGVRNCTWRSMVLREGDSLITIPVRSQPLYRAQVDRARRDHSRLRSLEAARQIAQDWVDADPTGLRARVYLATILIRLGHVDLADQQLLEARGGDPAFRYEVALIRIETEVKVGRGAEARALYDSVAREAPNTQAYNESLGPFGVLFGRLARFRSWSLAGNVPRAAPYLSTTPLVLLGLVPDSLNEIERAYMGPIPDSVCSPQCKRAHVAASLLYAPRAPRTWWPGFPPVVPDDRMAATRAIAAGDTAGLRLAARALDSVAHLNARVNLVEIGHSALSVEAYLALHDSASALRMTRFFMDSVMPAMNVRTIVGTLPAAGGIFFPRIMLQRADLAAAAGQKSEAIGLYKRLLDLWAEADPELQPTVARIRAAVSAR